MIGICLMIDCPVTIKKGNSYINILFEKIIKNAKLSVISIIKI